MAMPLKVLMVEASEGDAGRILRALEQAGLAPAAIRVAAPAAMLEALKQQTFDLVLSDYRLPGFDAAGALQVLREAGHDAPLIIVSAPVSEEAAVAALKTGASDFIRKDRLGQLPPAVERALRAAEARRAKAQAEDQLNTSNYQMRIMLDSLVEGVAQYDRAGRVQASNASARRILPEGDLEQLVAASIQEDGQAWPAAEHPVVRALKAGEACQGRRLGIRRNPGTVWVSLNATPLLYRSRDPWGVVVSCTDITGSRQESRRRELVADLLGMAQQAADAAGLAREMADRLALWSGCGQVLLTLGGEPAPAPAGAIRLTLNLGEGRGLLQFLQPRPGAIEALVPEALEEVAGIVANILAKTLAEAALREREAHFRALADSLARSEAMLAQAQALAGLGSWEVDLPSGERRWSPENYRHWDWDPALPLPSLEAQLQRVHPEDRGAYRTFYSSLRNAGVPMDLEYRLIAADGAVRFLHSQALPVAGATGARIQGATMDITSRKLSELAMRDMEKLTAKGQMAAYIAHEINNPLAGIRNAFLLLEDAIPAGHPHRSYVPLIKREIDRIGSIIRTMYHLYRPEPAACKRVVMSEVFQDLESLLLPKSRAYGARIAFDASGMGAQGGVNEGFFRQVLFNLIQNAVEASPPGGVVTVTARSADGDLEVAVGDDGSGISAAIAEHIFTPGFTTKLDTEMSGLGLGLSTCRSLVQTMGGTLGFQPKAEGRGTRFTVRLPFRDPS
jgi:signal transduction histidine kinase/CheY-like chemotaxis protein